jgi:Outer membrane protein beta-barrel domain
MKKSFLLLTSTLLMFQFSTLGQSLRYGFVGGLQTSSMTFSNGSGVSLNTGGRFGFNIGGIAEYGLTENIFFSPQITLSTKGANIIGSRNFNLSLTYLEIPLYGIYKYEVGNGKILGGFGPYIGIAISGKNTDNEVLEFGSNETDDLRRTDFGLGFKAGYELTESNLTICLFYNTGLRNLNPSTSQDVTIKNSTLGLSIAYFIGN